jgi:peptidoglycan/LPS O-acetylase OafA/YrhL
MRPAAEYRPDIDGLRAIAVLAVFVFHLNRRWLPGGFFGVDIFFVLSGYLITSIILRDCEAGRFGFGRFYQRRIARLLPAFLAVAVATLMAAALIYSPQDLASTGATLSAAAASVANLKFLLQGNYFVLSPDSQPFLHCWSLSVEEQFYLLFPALLLFCRRTRVLVALCAVSLVCYVVMGRVRPEWAFYLLPARAWELLAGSVVAARGTARLKTPSQMWRSLQAAGSRLISTHCAETSLGAAGKDACATPCHFSSRLVAPRTMRTPLRGALWARLIESRAREQAVCVILIAISFASGRYPILAVLGTSCLLLSGGARVLSSKPLVLIGRMSYSLYLWHWPVFSLVDYQLYWQPAIVRLALKVSISFGAAAACFLLVERPGRVVLNQPAKRRLAFAALAASMAVLVPLGIVVRNANYVNADARAIRDGGLRFNAGGRNGSMVLMGDSNGSMYGKMATEIAHERDLRLDVISVEAGDPLPKTALWRDSLAVVKRESPDFLLLVCNWNKLADDRTRLSLALRELKPYARDILLLTQPPVLPENATREGIREGNRPPFREDAAARAARMERNDFVKSVQGGNVRVVDIEPLFSRQTGEIHFAGARRTLLYQDRDHLSAAGAELVKPALLKAMNGLTASR